MGSLALSLVCVLTVGVGCSAPPTEAEHLGQMELAVYPGCATVTADDDIYSSYCSSEWSDSPNTSYDHGASCPGRWVVEFTGAVDYISNWGQDGWGDTLPTTSTTCGQARWESDGYWYDGSTWHDIEKVMGAGNWVGGVCTWTIDTTYQQDIGASATKVRVASKAWLATWPLQTKKKARSWVGGTSCFGGG